MKKTNLPPPKETEITKQILEYLDKCRPDIFAWKQWQGPMSQPGVSDILGMIKGIFTKPEGRFLAIEIKRPGRKPTLAQQRFLDNVNDMGGLGIVVHSLDELIKKLEV